MFPVFSDRDEDQSVGGQAPGGETEDAAKTWCRCWKGKSEQHEDMTNWVCSHLNHQFNSNYFTCVSFFLSIKGFL